MSAKANRHPVCDLLTPSKHQDIYLSRQKERQISSNMPLETENKS